MRKFLPVDIETTGLSFNKDTILGIGAGDSYSETARSLPPLPATAQNGKFEFKFMKKAGIPFDWQFDTLYAASILIDRPQKLDLATLANYYLNWESWKSETDKLFKKKNWVQLLKENPELQKSLRERNIYDLKSTAALTEVLQQRLEKENMTEFFYDKLMPAARMLAEVEYRGMRIDIKGIHQKLTQIDQKVAELLIKLNLWAGIEINWNSPKQLMKLLKERGYNLWIYDFKKKETVESTGVDVLERLLPNPNIQLLLDYREAAKIKGFLEGWLEEQYEGRLFPSYNMASTRTGRLSCSNPNMQQIPRDRSIRSLFIPSPGMKYVIADYSQIEPRVAAHYSQDAALLEVFTSGLDLYGSIAVNVLGTPCLPNEVKTKYPEDRKTAKEIGLSVLYGIGAKKLSSLLTKRTGRSFTEEDGRKIIRDYFKAYPGLLKFREYVEDKILCGDVLKTHYGRQFEISESKAFSQGVNTIVQSTASDACLFSQLKVDKILKQHNIEAPLVAIVHDEVIRECRQEYTQIVGAVMEAVMCDQKLNVPLKLDWVIGDSWGDKN